MTLGGHGELLVGIHHLRLVGGWTWLLHVKVLLLRGTTVECWTSAASASRNGIREAIRGGVHGWIVRAVGPQVLRLDDKESRSTTRTGWDESNTTGTAMVTQPARQVVVGSDKVP